MIIEQAVESMKKSLYWENWSTDQADAIRTLLLEIGKIKALEEENEALRNRIDEKRLINNYKELLKSRYDSFKNFLYADNFVPDAKEVWNMYSNAFYENNGIYYQLASILGIELYDGNGKLNECHIYLDNVNKDLSNVCTEYIEKILPQL